jgi:hypothetical protein
MPANSGFDSLFIAGATEDKPVQLAGSDQLLGCVDIYMIDLVSGLAQGRTRGFALQNNPLVGADLRVGPLNR